MPSIMIDALICFILTGGVITEAKVLGGNAVVMDTQDIQRVHVCSEPAKGFGFIGADDPAGRRTGDELIQTG